MSEPLLPPHLVVLLRKELPSLCDEIITEISTGIPAFEPLVTGAYRTPARAAVAANLTSFVDQLSTPDVPCPARDRLCRELGELQAPYDDGLRRLEEAIRITVRVAWQRALSVFRLHRVPARFHYVLADRLFQYVEEATALAREGYRRALSQPSPGQQQHRLQLVRELLGGGGAKPALRQLAARAAWPVPDEVTVLVAGHDALTDQARLHTDVLLDTAGQATVLVVPGALGSAREEMLDHAVRRGVLAAGPALPLAEAPESLRLARRALRLAEAGVIAGPRLVHSEDHLLTMWLAAEPQLGERLVGRQLAAFDHLSAGRRRRMIETLRCWLETHGDAHEMALVLGVHPQTARYRVRALRDLIGPAIDDPEWRICTEVTLRSLRVAEQLAQAAGQ